MKNGQTDRFTRPAAASAKPFSISAFNCSFVRLLMSGTGTAGGFIFGAVLFFIDSASVSLAVKKSANLHAVLKDGVIQHIVFDRHLADLVLHRAVCPVELMGVGELRDALYRFVKLGQQIAGSFWRVQRVGNIVQRVHQVALRQRQINDLMHAFAPPHRSETHALSP